MDEQTRGFRSAIFGGFNREDVMHYIEETDTKYYTETAELRSQLTEAQSAMNELRTQNEALTAKNAELLERLGEMTLDTDKIRAQLDQIESGFSLQATEIEAQNARAAQLAAENDRLTSENAKLSAKCGEYDATREKIAEMELSAYRRAKQIEEDAKVELQKLRRKSMETIEQVRHSWMPPRRTTAPCWHATSRNPPSWPARPVKCSVKLTRSARRSAKRTARRPIPSRTRQKADCVRF